MQLGPTSENTSWVSRIPFSVMVRAAASDTNSMSSSRELRQPCSHHFARLTTGTTDTRRHQRL